MNSTGFLEGEHPDIGFLVDSMIKNGPIMVCNASRDPVGKYGQKLLAFSRFRIEVIERRLVMKE
jgi:hypothetical protein